MLSASDAVYLQGLSRRIEMLEDRIEALHKRLNSLQSQINLLRGRGFEPGPSSAPAEPEEAA